MFSLFSKHAAADLTAVGLHADGVSLARVARDGAGARLRACEFRPWSGDGESKVLAKLAGEHHLKRARCTTFLDETEYKLLLTEAPDVRPDELRAAVRWRVKDLIDFHINDATLDVFDLPGAEGRGKSRAMYAVVARNQAIHRRVDLMGAAGVNLDVIDIPEMAQRNLAALVPEDARGIVMLTLSENSGLITVTKQGSLFLSRALDAGRSQLQDPQHADNWRDRIGLEIQRSLDYYESHFHEAPINQVYLAPGADVAGLADYLQGNLNLNVKMLDVAQALGWQGAIPQQCLLSIGAALRHEVKAL